MYKKLDFYRIKAAGSHALGVIIIEGLDWWRRQRQEKFVRAIRIKAH